MKDVLDSCSLSLHCLEASPQYFYGLWISIFSEIHNKAMKNLCRVNIAFKGNISNYVIFSQLLWLRPRETPIASVILK